MDFKKSLTNKIVDTTEKKYLQAIDNLIAKSVIKTLLEVIRHLFKKYGQVRQTMINKHEQSFESIVYTLKEPLSTVFMQIEDL